MAKRYVLTSEVARVKSKNPNFELQLPDVEIDGEKVKGKVITLPAAKTLPDNVLELTATQPVRAAQILLGDDYEHFRAGGGTAAVLWEIVQENDKATMGESDGSEAS